MSGRFAAAIRRVGSTAALLAGGGEVGFSAAVQPAGTGEEISTSTGVLREERFKLFAPTGCAADRLEPGSRIRWEGEVYQVLAAETWQLGGKAVYRRATLRREEAPPADW